ncbi:MAG TPA: hypothetical protein VGO67_15270 [Verrucomicrobiae bacterium]
MNRQLKTSLLNAGFSIVAIVAVVFAVIKVTQFHESGEAGAKVWFFDQKSNRLYPASRNRISPDSNDGNRVRAVVIGFKGLGNDPRQLKVAYLEKYSPEFNDLLERASAAHAASKLFAEEIPPPSSAYYQTNTFVKRPGDAEWRAVGSDEGRQIMADWREWHGPGGQTPVISVPSNH